MILFGARAGGLAGGVDTLRRWSRGGWRRWRRSGGPPGGTRRPSPPSGRRRRRGHLGRKGRRRWFVSGGGLWASVGAVAEGWGWWRGAVDP